MKRFCAWLVMLTGILPAFVVAETPALTPAFVTGTWVFGEEGGCADPKADRVMFDADGTFKFYRAGMLDAVGFWEIRGGLLVTNLLARPHQDKTESAYLRGRYKYVYHQPAVEIKDDNTVVVSFNVAPDMETVTQKRCR